MNTFNSLIYIKPNVATDEKIAVAMLASGINKIHFAYSKSKLHKAFVLANVNSGKPIEKYFKNMFKSINEDNNKEIHFSENYALTKEYLNYLNRYDNGLIYFEKPTSMAFAIDDNQFAELFKLMIGEPLENKNFNYRESFSKFIRTKLESHRVLKEKADIIYSVNPDYIDSIVNSVEVDYIAVNGAICAGMHIDFCAEPNTIIKHIYEYKNLAIGLNKFSERMGYKESPNYNIYFNSPENKNQYEILDKLIKDDSVLGILAKESTLIEKDIEKIEVKNYRKFSIELEKVT